MKSITLYLVRHGETDWNREGRIQGQLETPLNTRGRAQAAQLASAAKAWGLNTVVTSPQERAFETALATSLACNAPLTQDDNLREQSFGDVQGSTYETWRTIDPAGFARYEACDLHYAPANGETRLALHERAKWAMTQVAQNALAQGHAKTLVVSHGAFISAFYRLVAGLPPNAPRTWSVVNCALTECTFDTAGAWTLNRFCDTAHLTDSLDEILN